MNNIEPEDKYKVLIDAFATVGVSQLISELRKVSLIATTEKYTKELTEIYKDYYIQSFEKSEETESGVFGVHIVFEKKNDKNKDEINPIEIVEKLLKTSKIISITEDTPDLHNPYQKETTVKFITKY